MDKTNTPITMKLFVITLLSLSFLVNANAQLIFNEVCYDPSNVGLEGDANGDGTYNQTQDEFVELINTGNADLDISRYRICDRVLATGLKTVRHTVARGTIIPPGGAFVVFGGGAAVGAFGGAIVRVDLGTQGLSLANSGESVLVEDSLGNFVDSLDTDALSDNPNESYTRNPDITGNYVQHNTAAPGKLFSPGTRVNGAPFNTVLTVQADAAIHRFSIWPNPAKDKVRFRLNAGESGSFELVNKWGQRLQKFESKDGLLDIAEIPNGLYFIQATVNGQRYSSKLLIER